MKNSLPAGILILLFTSGCVHQPEVAAQPAVVCSADTMQAVSFSASILPVLKANCATSGCHSGSIPTGNLDLDTAVAYTQLTKPISGYIDTASPQSSLLYSMLTSTADPMPPTGKLDDCTLKLITAWMGQGAHNN